MPEMLPANKVNYVAVPAQQQPVAAGPKAPTPQAAPAPRPEAPPDPFELRPGPALIIIPHEDVPAPGAAPVQQRRRRGQRPRLFVRGGEEEASFHRAIQVAPQDMAPRLIYADWLDEHGESDLALGHRKMAELIHAGTEPPLRTIVNAQWGSHGRHQDHLLIPWLVGHPNDPRLRIIGEVLHRGVPAAHESNDRFRHMSSSDEIGALITPPYGSGSDRGGVHVSLHIRPEMGHALLSVMPQELGESYSGERQGSWSQGHRISLHDALKVGELIHDHNQARVDHTNSAWNARQVADSQALLDRIAHKLAGSHPMQRGQHPVRMATPEEATALQEEMYVNPRDRAHPGILADALEEAGYQHWPQLLRQIAQSPLDPWNSGFLYDPDGLYAHRASRSNMHLRGEVHGVPVYYFPIMHRDTIMHGAYTHALIDIPPHQAVVPLAQSQGLLQELKPYEAEGLVIGNIHHRLKARYQAIAANNGVLPNAEQPPTESEQMARANHPVRMAEISDFRFHEPWLDPLRQAIRRSDVATPLIYADALEEQGDPRHQIVRDALVQSQPDTVGHAILLSSFPDGTLINIHRLHHDEEAKRDYNTRLALSQRIPTQGLRPTDTPERVAVIWNIPNRYTPANAPLPHPGGIEWRADVPVTEIHRYLADFDPHVKRHAYETLANAGVPQPLEQPKPEQLRRGGQPIRNAATDNEGLLRNIAANPWDDNLHGIYADSLQETDPNNPLGRILGEYAKGEREGSYYQWRDNTNDVASATKHDYRQQDDPNGIHMLPVGHFGGLQWHAQPTVTYNEGDPLALFGTIPHAAWDKPKRFQYALELEPHEVQELAKAWSGPAADNLLHQARVQWAGHTDHYRPQDTRRSYDEMVGQPPMSAHIPTALHELLGQLRGHNPALATGFHVSPLSGVGTGQLPSPTTPVAGLHAEVGPKFDQQKHLSLLQHALWHTLAFAHKRRLPIRFDFTPQPRMKGALHQMLLGLNFRPNTGRRMDYALHSPSTPTYVWYPPPEGAGNLARGSQQAPVRTRRKGLAAKVVRLLRQGRPVRNTATPEDIAGLHQAIAANPVDKAPWLIAADAHEESGRPALASLFRQATKYSEQKATTQDEANHINNHFGVWSHTDYTTTGSHIATVHGLTLELIPFDVFDHQTHLGHVWRALIEHPRSDKPIPILNAPITHEQAQQIIDETPWVPEKHQRRGRPVKAMRGGEEEEAFLNHIRENPQDQARHNAYADWLMEHGDDQSERDAYAHERLASDLSYGEHPINVLARADSTAPHHLDYLRAYLRSHHEMAPLEEAFRVGRVVPDREMYEDQSSYNQVMSGRTGDLDIAWFTEPSAQLPEERDHKIETRVYHLGDGYGAMLRVTPLGTGHGPGRTFTVHAPGVTAAKILDWQADWHAKAATQATWQYNRQWSTEQSQRLRQQATNLRQRNQSWQQPEKMAREQAPAGDLIARGLNYKGGQFLPKEPPKLPPPVPPIPVAAPPATNLRQRWKSLLGKRKLSSPIDSGLGQTYTKLANRRS